MVQGFSADAVYCGNVPPSAGCLYYQKDGSRSVLTLSLADAYGLARGDDDSAEVTIRDAVRAFEELTDPEKAPSSLRQARDCGQLPVKSEARLSLFMSQAIFLFLGLFLRSL